MSHISVILYSSYTHHKIHPQSIHLSLYFMNASLDLTETISLTKTIIIKNLIDYIGVFLRLHFSFHKLPHPLQNMHSYRPCPTLQRTTPTTLSFLHPRRKRSLQGRKEKSRQNQISNYNSLLYYCILVPANFSYNFFYSSSAKKTSSPLTFCSTQKSHYCRTFLLTTSLTTQCYLFKCCTCFCPRVLYMYALEYLLRLNNYLCHDMLVCYYLDALLKLNYVSAFFSFNLAVNRTTLSFPSTLKSLERNPLSHSSCNTCVHHS